MNITSTQLRTQNPSYTSPQSSAPQESSTFGPDLDPFSGIKDGFSRAGEGLADFTKGAIPGYGAVSQFNESFDFYSGFSNGKANLVGAGFNAAGTVSLAVAGFQAVTGADPSTALMIGAAGLGSAGVANVIARA